MSLSFDFRRVPSAKSNANTEQAQKTFRESLASLGFSAPRRTDKIDFSTPAPGVAEKSEEQVRREESARRMDRLLPEVQRLCTRDGVMDLELLELVNAVAQKAARSLGQILRIAHSELAKELGLFVERADQLFDEAVARGYLCRSQFNLASAAYQVNLSGRWHRII